MLTAALVLIVSPWLLGFQMGDAMTDRIGDSWPAPLIGDREPAAGLPDIPIWANNRWSSKSDPLDPSMVLRA